MKKQHDNRHIVSRALAEHLIRKEGFRLAVHVQLEMFPGAPTGPVFVAIMASRTVIAEQVIHINSQSAHTVINSLIEQLTNELTAKAPVIHTT